jgi:hypothetical protein
VNVASALIWGGLALGGLAALYGLHRLALRWEERGWIYYLKSKPSGGAAGCLGAFQEAIEPNVKHVIVVQREGLPRFAHQTPDGSPHPPLPEPGSAPHDSI